MFNSIAFLGLGLIGGSAAKAVRRLRPDIRIAAYDPHTAALAAALTEGVIDQALPAVDGSLADCDLIFLCMPVSSMEDTLRRLKQYAKPTAVFTDVGSTKVPVHEAVQRLELEARFVGGHPMAGSERSGYDAADERLLENAYYALTPCAATPPETVAAVAELVEAIGAIPLVMSPEKHDRAVAGVSHLPHIIAASLVNLVHSADDSDQTMKTLAAGGFKDITRIASSSPELWEHICLNNQQPILRFLEQYIDDLNAVLTHLRAGDGAAVHRLFDDAGKYRASLPDGAAGALSKEYALYCDIADQAGAIATISTTLAIHQISLKNIGIVHNRDFEEGVLKIVFYREQDCRGAVKVLRDNKYVVHEKN